MQKINKYFVLYSVIFTILAGNSLSAKGDLKEPSMELPPFQWRVGEELKYKVKYSFLTVGMLHFVIMGKEVFRGRNVYRCKMNIKSNSSIPFVDIDDTYISLIDEKVFSHRSEAWEKQSDHMLYTLYDFNYDAKKIFIYCEKHFEKDTVVVIDSTTAIDQPVQDGFSLLFYARANVEKVDTADVTVFSFGDYRRTNINFTGGLDDVKAKGQKVYGYYLDGKMKFVGIAGLKEDFEGWFAQDAQRVPLRAKMKAFLGSVRLNLEWWKDWDGVVKPDN